MTLHVTHTTRIRDLQWKFNRLYPYLKIEFFSKPHGWSQRTGDAFRFNPDFRIHTIQKKDVALRTLSLHPWEKTGDVEQELGEHYGLYVQIFRRQGYHWIETAGTDELTLDEQNEIGKTSLQQQKGSLWIEREVLL